MPGVETAQARILRAAAQVFCEQGTRTVTVADLLLASDVSRRTFYKLFRDQEDVLRALFEIATEMFAGVLIAALESPGTSLQKVERCVDAYLRFHQTQGSLMRVLQSEARQPDSTLAARRRQVLTRIATALDASIPAPAGQVDPLVHETLLVALEGVSVWLADESAGTPEDLERARRVMMRFSVAVLAPSSEKKARIRS